MKSVYVRASMVAVQDGGRGRARNSRSMQSLGYYCFKCQQFWTDDLVYRIVEELQEKRIQQYLSSQAAKKWT
jgi:REP element-mobilizing transposase RayT